MPAKKLNILPRANTTKQISAFYTEMQLNRIKDILNELKHYITLTEDDEQFPSPYDEGIPF